MNLRSPLQSLRTVSAKLLWLVAIISGTVAIAVSLASGIRTFASLQEQRTATIGAQATIVAVNTSAALAFDDRAMAADALAALRVVEGIERATLLDADGAVFATFVAADADPLPPAFHPLGLWHEGDAYALVVPVADEAGVHGRLQVNYRDTGRWRIAGIIALQSVLLFAGAMLLAWLMARRMQPLLTAPIQELERATRHVRDTGRLDVRARRTSNDELGRLTDDFNQMLDQIASTQRELQQAQRRAEESSRLKDEFVATLSHELRTPLSPVVAWLQLLRLPQGAAKLPQALDVMERNTRALTLIINDLLDMSRIVSGTLRLDVRDVDIDATIRAAVETVTLAANAREQQLELQLAPPPPLRGDPARLQQVVWNLLSNAVKFSERGGRIVLRTRTDEDRYEIEVADAGMGIDPAFLPHVFDRFRQQDGSTTRAHGGLGLGLAIVRQLVELHGGSVCAHSDGPGAGAVFTVRLPVSRQGPQPRPLPPVAGATLPGDVLAGLDVLVIEDEADMRALIRTILEDAGARVEEAADATAALARFAACRPAVIVSDIGLPGVDGFALLARLRELQAGSAPIPAIALTAYARPDERQRAFEAGYQFHLSKPVTPDVLVATVLEARGRGAR